MLLGLQAGCDLQAGNWVVGLQGEYGWTDARDSNRNSLIAGLANRTEIKTLGTATARLGYAWDRFLGYIKGGAAWEHDNYEMYLVGTDLVTATASETRGGWTAGFGAEIAFLPPVSGFVEANYYDFGRKQNYVHAQRRCDLSDRDQRSQSCGAGRHQLAVQRRAGGRQVLMGVKSRVGQIRRVGAPGAGPQRSQRSFFAPRRLAFCG